MRERSLHTLPRNHCFYKLENWNRTFKRVNPLPITPSTTNAKLPASDSSGFHRAFILRMIHKIILPRINCFGQMENWNRIFKKRVVKKETQDFRRLLFIHQIKIRMLNGVIDWTVSVVTKS